MKREEAIKEVRGIMDDPGYFTVSASVSRLAECILALTATEEARKFTPPRYDSVYHEGTAALDAEAQGTPAPPASGEVRRWMVHTSHLIDECEPINPIGLARVVPAADYDANLKQLEQYVAYVEKQGARYERCVAERDEARVECERLRGCKFSDRDYRALKARAEQAETKVERVKALRRWDHVDGAGFLRKAVNAEDIDRALEGEK